MCIMSLTKPNAPKLTEEVVYRCFERNPHGAGVGIAYKNKLLTAKGFFNVQSIWQFYNSIPNDATVLLHFRAASGGLIDKTNCHPWKIDKNHLMAHNGTIWDFWSEDSKISDTGHFTHQLLKPLFKRDRYAWRKKVNKYLLCKAIFPGKMVILRNNGDFVIFNENLGEWYDDTWFSNDGYLDESEYCHTCYPRQLYLPLTFKETEVEDFDTPEEMSLLD